MANHTNNTRWLLPLVVVMTPWVLVGCGSKPQEDVQNQVPADALPKGQVAPVAGVPLLPVAPKDENPPVEKEAQPPPERKDDEAQKKAALEDEYRALKRAMELGWDVGGIDQNLRHTRIALGVLRDEKDLELLLKFPALTWLHVDVQTNGKLVDYNILSDDAFRTIGKLKTLESLIARGQVVTDKAAEELTKLERLQYLNLKNARLSDSSLAIIGRIPNLRYLNLDETTRYKPHKLSGLTGLKKLRSLSLDNAPYEEGSYAFLRDMPSLESLKIGGHKVESDKTRALSDENLAGIGQLTNLKELEFGFVMKPEQLQFLQKLTGLRRLRMWGADGNVGYLRGLRFLRDLRQLDADSTDRLFTIPDRHYIIKTLDRGKKPEVISETLPEFINAGYRNEQNVILFLLSRPSARHVMDASPLISKATYLDFSGLSVTDDDLAGIGAIADLEALNLLAAPITAKGLAHLRPLKKLKYLRLCGANIGDDDIKILAELPSLEFVCLTDTWVTDKGAQFLKDANLRLDCRTSKTLVPAWLRIIDGPGGKSVSDAPAKDSLPLDRLMAIEDATAELVRLMGGAGTDPDRKKAYLHAKSVTVTDHPIYGHCFWRITEHIKSDSSHKDLAKELFSALPKSDKLYELKEASAKTYNTYIPKPGEDAERLRDYHYLTVAFDPTLREAAVTVSLSGLHILDLETGKLRHVYSYRKAGDRINRAVWSPDGSRIAFVTANKQHSNLGVEYREPEVLVVDSVTGKTLLKNGVEGDHRGGEFDDADNKGGFGQVSWNDVGDKVAGGWHKYTKEGAKSEVVVKVWDSRTWRESLSFATPTKGRQQQVKDITFLKDQNQLAVAYANQGSYSPTVTTWNITTKNSTSAKVGGVLSMLDHDTGTLSLTHATLGRFGEEAAFFCPSKEGTIVGSTSGNLGTISRTIFQKSERLNTERIAFSPDGELIAAVIRHPVRHDTYEAICLIDPKTFDCVCTIPLHQTGWIRSLQFDATSKKLAVAFTNTPAHKAPEGESISVKVWTVSRVR